MEHWIFYLPVLFLTFPVLHFFAKRTKKVSGKLPPGPPPLRIIGNLLQLGERPHISLANLANVYGPIMSLKLGRITTVVISSANLAKATLQTHDVDLSGRLPVDAIHALDHHLVSLPWLPTGAPWRNLRKICNSYIFAHHKLDISQDLRHNKIQQLIDDVQESCYQSKAIDISQAAFRTTLNALSSTVFSLDLSDSSSDMVKEFKEVVRSIMDEAGKPNLSDYFPFIRKIDPQGIRHRMEIYFAKLVCIFDRLIDERKQLRKQEGYIPAKDILDILLSLNDDDNNSDMDRNWIKHFLLDLFAAGTDTTSTTLEWAMTELLRNPETLSKAKAELCQIIGKGKMVYESDVARLPYLQAIIKETMRLHPAVPLLLPRKAGADVEMCGFIIPKGAQVLVNSWAIGRDPSSWNDPNLFLPERFLESEIDVKGRNFELIPFGGGRRICPGLPLAMRMLNLMLGSLVNCFDWKLENGVTAETMDMDDKFGLTLQKAIPLRAVPIAIM